MKSMALPASRITSASVKGWILGVGCGILLTITGAAVVDRFQIDEPAGQQPVAVVEQTAPGLIPPPLNEEQIYRRQPTIDTGTGLVPPPVDEFQMHRRGASEFQLPALDQSNPLRDK